MTKYLLLALLSCVLPCNASVSVDQMTGANSGNNATTALSYNCTVGASTNLLFVIGHSRTGNTPSSVTVNGTSITEVTSEADGNGSAQLTLYSEATPPTGTLAIVVNGASDIWTSTCISIIGAGTATNGTSEKGTSTTPSATITSATGSLVIDFVGQTISTACGSNMQAPTAGQTQLIPTGTPCYEAVGNGITDVSSTKAGAASVTMSWTLTGTTHFWAQIIETITAAAATSKLCMRPLLGAGPC